MKEKEVGEVTHYYDRAMVAVLKLSGSLAVGDTIKIQRGEHEFEQKVSSMQVEHEEITAAKKGDEIGVKVVEPTKEGARVYKLE